MKFSWMVGLLVVAIAVLLFFGRHGSFVSSTAVSTPAANTAPDDSPSPPSERPVLSALRARTNDAAVPVAIPPEVWQAGAHHLQVFVRDTATRPLEGALVSSVIRHDRSRMLSNITSTATTSSHGIADVLWPTHDFTTLELQVTKAGYGTRKMVWNLPSGDQIPGSYTITLGPGVVIGGVVVDTNGAPVEAATVSLSRFWLGSDEMKNKGEEVTLPPSKQITAADGRWYGSNIAPELLERISISATHSNYLPARASGIQAKPEMEQELKALAYKLVLKRGTELAGRVLNQQRQPIAGAQVWAGRKFTSDRKGAKTDADGKFSMRNVPDGRLDMSASAEGYAPTTKVHDPAASAEVEFVLEPGSIIRGTVQDETGQPIEKVRVVLEGTGYGDPAYEQFEFSTQTDAQGKFEWKSAPNAPMPFYIGKAGYEQQRNVRLKPGEDNVVTLRAAREVHGIVLDAQTQQPVTNFSIALGRSYTDDHFTRTSPAKEFNTPDGTFKMTKSEAYDSSVQATAKGYAEEVQSLPDKEAADLNVTFHLKPSLALTGIVVSAQGQPVPDVFVAVIKGPMANVQFSKGKLTTYGSQKVQKTGADGRFSIESPPETGTVVASSTNGYASATVESVRSSGMLTLQGFGRIQGMLVIAGVPMPGREVYLTMPNRGMNFDFNGTKQTTDEQGRFAFESVPPGTVSVIRLIKTSKSSWAHSHRTDVTVVSGQTTEVILGGTDGTIHGTARFEEPPTEQDYKIVARLSTAMPQPAPNASPDERKAFYSSAEYKEAIKNMRSYTAVAEPDGTLLLDSVPPGRYSMHVTADKQQETSAGSVRTSTFAQGTTTIVVPEGANPNTPIPAGEVLLKRMNTSPQFH